MSWYALQTRSNTEEIVEAAVHRARLDAFYPSFEKTDRRRRISRRPFFPGYVFVDMQLDERARLVRIPYIVRIVGRGAEPVAIPDVEIVNVRKVTEYAVKVVSCPAELFSEGQEVIVTEGPMKGVTGTVMRLKNATRLVVLVTMLNQAVSAEIDATAVRAIQPLAA